jgi:hypothetical protein
MRAESASVTEGVARNLARHAHRSLTRRYGFPVLGNWIMGIALPETCGI